MLPAEVLETFVPATESLLTLTILTHPPWPPQMALTVRKDSNGQAEGAISRDGRKAAEFEPSGFKYRDGVITEEEESALVESLAQLDLKAL